MQQQGEEARLQFTPVSIPQESGEGGGCDGNVFFASNEYVFHLQPACLLLVWPHLSDTLVSRTWRCLNTRGKVAR